MRKYIFIILIIIITLVSIYLYNNKHVKSVNNSDMTTVTAATTTITATSVSTSTDELSLLRFVSKIYSDKKYSNGKNSSCINSLLKSFDSLNTHDVVKKSCSDISKDFDFFAHPYTEESLREYVLINDLLDHSEPIKKYLAMEKGSTDKNYEKIYSRYVYSKTIGDIYEKISTIYDEEYHDGNISDILSFEFMNVSSSTDLVVITDLTSSGAYNLDDSVYQVDFTKDDINLNHPTMIDNLTYYTKHSKSLITTQDIQSTDSMIDLTNSYFDRDNKTLNIYGFKPFGIFPCNVTSVYTFFDDRLILTSKKQARDCKKFDIEEPDDIPENFDSTLEDIYKISPSLLEKAKKMII